jgi:hypothetical protein
MSFSLPIQFPKSFSTSLKNPSLQKSANLFDQLPTDVNHQILKHLELNDAMKFNLVSKKTKIPLITALESVKTPFHIQDELYKTTKNDLLITEMLMKNPNIDKNKLLLLNINKNRPASVEKILQDKSFRIEDAILTKPAEKGNKKMVEILMKDDRVNPADGFDEALEAAASKGHNDIAKLLISDPRVSPDYVLRILPKMKPEMRDILTAAGNAKRVSRPFIDAAERGDLKKMKKLLSENDQIQPAYQNNAAITLAAQNKHFDIVQFLMTLPEKYKIDDEAKYIGLGHMFLDATMKGNSGIVKAFLAESITKNPKLTDMFIKLGFQLAVENRQTEVLELLLKDPGFID